MAYLDGYYLNSPHVWQYDGSPKANANCTPTTGANGVNASSGGHVQTTGAAVRKLVLPREESSPKTPGWSMYDLDLAMTREGIGFGVRVGYGWKQLVEDHNSGLYLAVQGDQDQFSAPKCSAAFDGDHCIGVHPATQKDPATGREQWWVNDPICPTGGWRFRADIFDYGKKLGDKFDTDFFYGVFTQPVPLDPNGNKWGTDVGSDLQSVDRHAQRTVRALTAKRIDFKTAVNMIDLAACFTAYGVHYGKVIEPKDLRNLLRVAGV